MPSTFTSQEFNRLAIFNGLPADSLKSKPSAKFINRYADNEFRGKTWTKREVTEQLTLIPNPEVLKYTEEVRDADGKGLAEAIEIVKAAGYKIMKPVNDWIEL
mgnify:CR=1 FL=1